MSYSIHITAAAEQDMADASDYIESVLKNPQAADDLLTEANKKINDLSSFPKKFPLVDDSLLASWGIHFIQIKNYLAFYIILEKYQKVIIVRFLYRKSNWSFILKHSFSLL